MEIINMSITSNMTRTINLMHKVANIMINDEFVKLENIKFKVIGVKVIEITSINHNKYITEDKPQFIVLDKFSEKELKKEIISLCDFRCYQDLDDLIVHFKSNLN